MVLESLMPLPCRRVCTSSSIKNDDQVRLSSNPKVLNCAQSTYDINFVKLYKENKNKAQQSKAGLFRLAVD